MSTPAAAQAAARPSGPPRVVLVDDHGLFRSGVRAELGPRVEVLGEGGRGRAACEEHRGNGRKFFHGCFLLSKG